MNLMKESAKYLLLAIAAFFISMFLLPFFGGVFRHSFPVQIASFLVFSLIISLGFYNSGFGIKPLRHMGMICIAMVFVSALVLFFGEVLVEEGGWGFLLLLDFVLWGMLVLLLLITFIMVRVYSRKLANNTSV
jgi:hypothetical protein